MTEFEESSLEKKVGTQAKSPLFAMLAQRYLDAGKAQEALKVCDSGLAHFPFYTTAHLVKGKSLAALSLHAEARREFEFVLNFLPANEYVKNLLASIPPGSDESLTPGKNKTNVPSQPVLERPAEAAPEISSPEPSSITVQDFSFGSQQQPAPPANDFGFGSLDPLSYTLQSQPTAPEPVTGSLSSFEAPPPYIPAPSENDVSGFGGTFGTETPSAHEPFASMNTPGSQTLSTFFETSPKGFGISNPPAVIDVPSGPLTSEELSSFDVYATRRRHELNGENSLSFEEFMGEVSEPAAPIMPDFAANAPDQIEELTEKLQNVPRITPVINFAQKEVPAASEEDAPSSMGFVTPTLAEIYAKQGWFDDAIKAYKTLAHNKPAEKEKFEKRVAELEELKKQSPNA